MSFGVPDLFNPIGDVNGDSLINASGIDLLFAATMDEDASLPLFDLTGDGSVTDDDVTHLVTEVLHTTFGDANLDGKVEFSDILILANHFGTSGSGWSNGDFDGDEDVDFADFLVLAQHFGFGGGTL